MTRKKFVIIGLSIIALGPLSIAFQSFLLLSEVTLQETKVYFDLFSYVALPFVFGLLICRRLNYIGKDLRFTTYYCIGLLTTFFISLFVLLPLLLMSIGAAPLGDLQSEITSWSMSGGKDDFNFSAIAKLKMSAWHAIFMAIANWPLFAALYLGTGGPRSPRGDNPLTRLSKHAVEKDNSALSLRKQMAS